MNKPEKPKIMCHINGRTLIYCGVDHKLKGKRKTEIISNKPGRILEKSGITLNMYNPTMMAKISNPGMVKPPNSPN